jgi:Rad3-related DNA helicase
MRRVVGRIAQGHGKRFVIFLEIVAGQAETQDLGRLIRSESQRAVQGGTGGKITSIQA